MYNQQAWTDGQEYTFAVKETDKEGLIIGEEVVLLTGINSNYNNVRIYGIVVNTSRTGRLTVLVERTVIQ